MQDKRDDTAQVEVEITNLYATEAELDHPKDLIALGLGANAPQPLITSMSNTKKGTLYDLAFRVFDGKTFRIASVHNSLYEAKLVGWRLNAKDRFKNNVNATVVRRSSGLGIA